jgi:hypothetical protein
MVAWLALESLVLDATLVDGQLVVATSARHLARRLDIGKDRAAAALARLRDAALLCRLSAREDGSARFVAARYSLEVAVSSLEDTASTTLPTSRAGTTRRAPRGEPDQLLRLDF